MQCVRRFLYEVGTGAVGDGVEEDKLMGGANWGDGVEKRGDRDVVLER